MTPEIKDLLKIIVGPNGWIENDKDKAAYLTDERDMFTGKSPLILRPASTDELSRIIKITSEAQIPIVPQGGNTGYCGGSIPDQSGTQILISLSRLNNIRDVDSTNRTMTVEAGCILKNIQTCAEEHDSFFPLSLGSEGSCQIGGNLSTNAGGTGVLRYGNTRDLVLGLEVVLPDGSVLDGLRSLRKDNTGYDLKHLFMGAEGTLGIITAAVLKLFPMPAEITTAFIAVKNPTTAIDLLNRLRAATGDSLTAFEYMTRWCMELVISQYPETPDPFMQSYEHYVIADLSSGNADGHAREILENTLAISLEEGEILDAVIASSQSQAQSLWSLRENISESQKRTGGSIKHDISIPVSKIPEFLEQASTYISEAIPGVRITPFGHLGDGNIHYNLSPPDEGDTQVFLAQSKTVSPVIHDIAVNAGGSFSAEHGIGVLKRGELERYKSSVELKMMQKIKTAIDPLGLMNPGKIVDSEGV